MYVIANDDGIPTAYCSYKDLTRTDWIIGKIVLKYKDKELKAEFIEYDNLIRFECLYKDIQVVRINLGKKGKYYTVLKNINLKSEKMVFDSLRGIKNYIDSFNNYNPEDKNWFLK